MKYQFESILTEAHVLGGLSNMIFIMCWEFMTTNHEKRKTKFDSNYSNGLARWIEINQKSNAFLKPLESNS